MNEPAFRWPHWACIRTDELLELSNRLRRRQELNIENETISEILFFSNNSLLASTASFSYGPSQVKGPRVLLLTKNPYILNVGLCSAVPDQHSSRD